MKCKLGNVSLCGGPVQKQWFSVTQSPSYFRYGYCTDLLWGHFEVIVYISSLTFYIIIIAWRFESQAICTLYQCFVSLNYIPILFPTFNFGMRSHQVLRLSWNSSSSPCLDLSSFCYRICHQLWVIIIRIFYLSLETVENYLNISYFKSTYL